MKISSICNRNPVIACQEDNLFQAAKKMRQHHVGSLIVISDEDDGLRPIGIVTDSDIIDEVIAEEISVNTISLKDIMSVHPVLAREDDEVTDTVRGMIEKGIHRVPIVNNRGYLVGVFTVDDLMAIISGKLNKLSALIQTEYENQITPEQHG